MASNKDLKTHIKAATRQGWRVELHKGHYKWYAPDGKGLVTCGSTEEDWRAIKNTISRLRAHGYVPPGR